jgi:predicted TIM-barrel fold metal-dependent hydrolase
MTHSGGGERSLGWDRPGGAAVSLAEVHWLCRRSLAELIFGGVFERHPNLRVVYTEQRAGWIPDTLRDFDSLYYSDKTNHNLCDQIVRPPSKYWATNCYTSGSFLAPYEIELRYKIGVGNLLWGADYPHTEGTWPRTMLALRNTFASVPEDETRCILGETALQLLALDGEILRSIADRIGPTPSQLAQPLAPDEFPEHPGLAFRKLGAYA